MSSYQYTIERRPKRRQVELQVSLDNTIRVLSPPHISETIIDAFVKRKKKWIDTVFTKNLAKQVTPKFYCSGETFLYLGQPYTLQVVQESNAYVHCHNTDLYVSVSSDLLLTSDHVHDQLMAWYKERAQDVLEDRVLLYSDIMNVAPACIRIKTVKTRWGSCSDKRNLNFNWCLILAPIDIIDYIVIHELAHLFHMDHSPRFWAKVGDYCLDYKKKRRWLRDQGHTLTLGRD